MQTKTLSRLYHVADTLLCLFVFLPSTVMYWRCTRDLWNFYSNGHLWKQFAIGVLTFLGFFIQPLLSQHLPKENKLLYNIAIKLYLYCYGALNMCLSRSVWGLADEYLPADLASNVIAFFACYIFLCMCLSGRSVNATPMYSSNDLSDNVLTPTTKFGTKPFSQLYMPDSLISFIFTMIATVTWRSSWNIAILSVDADPLTRDIYALIIGYILMVFIFLMEEPLAWLTLKIEKQGWLWKLIWEDVLYLIVFVATLIVWLGMWNLMAGFVFPAVPSGAWVGHAIGAALLAAFSQFGNVTKCGCGMDGTKPGRGAVFPTQFLRTHLLPRHEMKKVGMEKDLEGQVGTKAEKKKASEKMDAGMENKAFDYSIFALPGVKEDHAGIKTEVMKTSDKIDAGMENKAFDYAIYTISGGKEDHATIKTEAMKTSEKNDAGTENMSFDYAIYAISGGNHNPNLPKIKEIKLQCI